MVYLLPWQQATRAEQARGTGAVSLESLQRRERERQKGSQPSHANHDLYTRLPATKVTQILIRDGESFEGAIKHFTRKVQQDGVLSEAKRRRHYEPPRVKRKRKAEARARKARKAMAKAAARGL
jgi:small subunit ribosomal protein S21